MMPPPVDESFGELQAALGSRYTLQREIGRGGMATVYLADDTHDQRAVALKVLHAGLSAGTESERFRREIEIVTRLKHPNILPLLDSGRVGTVPFFVMPFVEGESLAQRMKHQHQLPVPEATSIAVDVLSALHHAHLEGVMHRDIKPENIMLSDAGAVLADFGIGKAVAGSDDASLTLTGMALGTPAYMSLEQAAGDPDLDTRSDQYSLAIVLYEMLAGRMPFTGESPQAMIAARFVQKVPPLQRVVPGISAALDAAVLRALSRKRDDRFATAGDFADAVRNAAC